MADKAELTAAQKAVVDHEGGALLVSAAAGSGKTFVLVQRLLRKICENDLNVDDFLIITFTKAAAAELRDKISKAIRERMVIEKDNTHIVRHLSRQLSRVYLANISTVHAFCAELLRDYAYRCDFTPDFRVLEEQSAISLMEEALNDTMERIYADPAEDPDRAAMLDSFAALHDDAKLRELIAKLQKQMCANAFPDEWVESCRQMLSFGSVDDASETEWGRDLIARTQRDLKDLYKLMRQICDLAEELFPGNDCCRVLSDEAKRLIKLSENKRWSEFKILDKSDFERLNLPSDVDAPEEKEKIKAIRALAKSAAIENCEKFAINSAQTLADVRSVASALRGVLDAACLYDKTYRQLKRKFKLLDFNDLERETVLLLTNGRRGHITPEAKEISERFTEIMVDEYQDTNEVQDVIYSALSKGGKNLVMVGDVKQSIYRFRLADPGIFLQKYHSFSENPKGPGEPKKILLSNNFRSRIEILDAANFVFRALMNEHVGGVVYGEGEELRPNPKGEPKQLPDDKVELHLIDTNGSEDNGVTIEARFIAGRIRELLDGEHYILENKDKRRICADDIAILLESLLNAPQIMYALQKAGIPARCERENNILDTSEVQTLFSYLRILDNPHQDVPLLAVLTSPICGFGADELAAVRCANKKGDFFEALRSYARHDKKSADFLRTLDDLREQRRWLQTEELLGLVVQRLELIPLFSALEDGEVRCQNLRHILTHLRSVIRSDVKTLTDLNRQIDLILENPKSISVGSGGSGVTITTIHKSKGLEYPVVFLSQLSRKFSTKDLEPPVLIDSKLGLGCRTVDSENLATYPNLTRSAIAAKIKAEGISERMRLLYVGMTRARERLIMTYAYPHTRFDKKLSTISMQASNPVSPFVAEHVTGMGEWVLYAAALRPESAAWFNCADRAHDCRYPWHIEYHRAPELEEVSEEKDQTAPTAPDFTALDRSYDLRASRIPAKLTATQLKGRALDEETAENAIPATGRQKAGRRERVFEPERKELTPTEKGTSQHLFMQFCNYAACVTPEGVEAEKRRLLEKRFLSEMQIAAVDTQCVLRFFESDLGRLVASSANVRREFKFSVLVDAGRFRDGGEGEKILLQGVIDCYVETDDGIVLLDFKTDRIRPGQEEERAQSYGVQLSVYSDAISRILGKKVIRRCLYFFATGETVEVPYKEWERI